MINPTTARLAPRLMGVLAILALTACNSQTSPLELQEPDEPLTLATAPAGYGMILLRGAGLETIGDEESPGHDQDARLFKTESGYWLVMPDEREVPIDDLITVRRDGREYGATTVQLEQDYMAFTMHGKAAGLTYSEYGDWAISDEWGVNRSVGAWATGIPTDHTPVLGTARYEGDATGKAKPLGYGSDYAFDVTGRAVIKANFADISVEGRIGNLHVMSDCGCAQPLEDIRLKGSILGNIFHGVAEVMGAAHSSHAMNENAGGTFGGRFYGPEAQEAAGTFRVENGGYGIVGSFGLQRVSP